MLFIIAHTKIQQKQQTMYDHLMLVSRERVIGTEIDETSNLVYTEIKIRTKKYDGAYLQSKDYPHLVEKELSTAEISNFKANRHLYTKVKENEHGTIYQHGTDFKKMYWSQFPKVEEVPKEVFEEKKSLNELTRFAQDVN